MFKASELRKVNDKSIEWQKVLDLLEAQEIGLDPHVDQTYSYFEGDNLVGTASVAGNTIRSIAIAKHRQGSNALAEMMNDVMESLFESGYVNIFIYTKPDVVQSFQNIGFYEVERAKVGDDSVVLLERKPDGIRNYVKTIERMKTNYEEIGAIVMNANPFTLGHLYLIEYAATHCEFLYVFVVSSEKSIFPFDTRMNLIKEGTKHIENVYVLNGGTYIISGATFPNYFLKTPDRATELQAKLDITIFARQIAKALNIKKRFIGTEPYCDTTEIYNRTMKEILTEYGIKVCEIPRKTVGEMAISASLVRQFIKEDRIEAVAPLVPKTTYDFLISKDASPIIEAIQKTDSRH